MPRRRSPYVGSALALLMLVPLLVSSSGGATSVARATHPQDRYAMAGGCYSVRPLAADEPVGRANGTFGLAAHAEPFHFQATDLGRYLLFGVARDFLAVSEGAAGTAAKDVNKALPGQVSALGTDTAAQTVASSPLSTATGRGASIVAASEANELADWEIDEPSPNAFTIRLPATDESLVVSGGKLALAKGDATGPASLFAFTLTSGCAPWPEVEVNVTGAPFRSDNVVDEVRGFDDGHLHGMAFEFLGGRVRCGRPWSPYGVTAALVDCPDHGTHGQTAVLEMVLSGGDPITGHSPEGWPSFEGWPKPGSLTHEQVYYKWLERAWRGGLRMMTNLLVDNQVLCEVYPYKKNSCNEMDGVRLQAKRLHEFERYIDAQNGGPGKGWFRIVTDPFQAREVIAQGKLAVVMGIEVSSPFNCFIKRTIAQCDEAQIDQQLDEVYALGVRQMELTNKFDNALTGVTGDNGSTGVIVNNGNMKETGQYWRMGTCPASMGVAHDNAQYNVHDLGAPDQLTGRDSIFGGVLEVSGESGVAPVYPQGPHCNVLGLTKLGEYAVRGLIKRGMIFDPDHMSARARLQAMQILLDTGYSGSISSHSWADETTYPRVYKAGGVVTPHPGSAQSFVDTWRIRRQQADPRFYFGYGYGSDVNGFSAQPAPAHPTGSDRVTYPFIGLGGVVIEKQHSGTKVYDINDDGVAMYGLYPDYIQYVKLLADKEHPGDGARIFDDMARGAEAYLEMWERAEGVRGDACRADVPDLTTKQFSSVHRGMMWAGVLRTLGQPTSRKNSQYRYCLSGGRSGVVMFGPTGSVVRSSSG